MHSPLPLAIHGAAGRMGRRLVALGSADPALHLVAAIDHPNSPHQGQDAGSLAGVAALGLPITSQWSDQIAVVIDFSSPAGCEAAVAACVSRKIPIVVASTGLEERHLKQIAEAANTIPVCHSPNMSLAVNLTMKLVEQAARALKQVASGVDVEILERHHRYKEDSPSGTALKFGQIIAEQMGIKNHVHGREGQVGARPQNEIGYHAIRLGDDPGQHTIAFGMLGEIIELRVGASNRDCYASGALAAAKFLVGKKPGLYSMMDVLNLADR